MTQEPDTLERIGAKEPKVTKPTPELPPLTREELFVEFEENILEIFGDTVSEVFNSGGVRTFVDVFNLEESIVDVYQRLADRGEAVENQRKALMTGFGLSKFARPDVISPVLKVLTLGRFEKPEIEGDKFIQDQIDAIVVGADSEFQTLTQEALDLNQKLLRAKYKHNYWLSLPPSWRTGEWTSFEQSLIAQSELQLTRPVELGTEPTPATDILTPEDIAEMQVWFEDISAAIIQIPGKVKLVELRDSYEKKARPRIVVLDTLTTEEILRNLTTVAMPEAIPGLSPEQVLILLSEFEGDSNLQQQLEDSRFYVEELAKQYTAERLMREAILTGLIDPSLPKMTSLDYMNFAVSQPALFLASEVLETFFSHVTTPWVNRLIRTRTLPISTAATGALVGGAIGGRFGFGIAGAAIGGTIGGALGIAPVIKYSAELGRLYDEARKSNESAWLAEADAWENWEQNIFIKIMLETGADPTILFGTGVFVKAAARVPFIGRYLGMPEAIFIRATGAGFRAVMPARFGVLPLFGGGLSAVATYQYTDNIPLSIAAGIVGMKAAGAIYSKIPKTLELAASSHAKSGTSLLIALSQDAVGPTAGIVNIRLAHIPVETMRNVAKQAVKIHIADPALGVAYNKMAQLGRVIFEAGHVWADKNSIKPLLAKLYIDTPGAASPLLKAQARLGTSESLVAFNDMLHWLRGTAVKNITEEEAIMKLAGFLGGNRGTGIERAKIVKEWVATWRTATYDRGMAALTTNTVPKLAIKGFDNTARQTFLTNARSDVFRHANANAWISSSQRAMDRMGQITFTNWIESNLVYPFSRHVLLFLNYGMFNVLENGVRTIFAGISPIIPRDVDVNMAWIKMSKGLRNAPIGFFTAAMDEQMMVIGPIAAVPASASEAVYGVAKHVEGVIPLVTQDISTVAGFTPGIRGTRIERWAKKIPDSMQSLAGWNRMWGREGSKQQSWALMNMFTQNIEKLYPAEAALAGAAFKPLEGRGLEKSITKKHMRNISGEVLRNMQVSPEAVEAMRISSRTDLEGMKYMHEITEALSRHPELEEPWQHAIMEAMPGFNSLSDIEEFWPRLVASWSEGSILGKSQAYQERLRDAFQQLSAYSPQNADEILSYAKQMQSLFDSLTGDQGIASNIYEMMIKRGDELAKTSDRRLLWSEGTEIVQSMTDDTVRQINFQIQTLEDTIRGRVRISLDHINFDVVPGLDEGARELLSNLPQGVREAITRVNISSSPKLSITDRTITITGRELTNPEAMNQTLKEVYRELLALESERGSIDNILPDLLSSLDEGVADSWISKWNTKVEVSEDALDELMDMVMESSGAQSALRDFFPSRPTAVKLESDVEELMLRWLEKERERATLWADPVNGPTAAQVRFHQDVFVSKARFRHLTEEGRHAFYLSKLAEVRSSWTAYKDASRVISQEQSDIARLIASSTGGVPDPINIRRPLTGKLSASDVVYLWGGEYAHIDDMVSKSMIDTGSMTMQSKEDFTRINLIKANSTVGEGSSAASYGFTPEALGEVYDGLMRSLSLDPGSVEHFTPATEMFKGIKQEMQGIFTTHAVSDDAVDILNTWYKDIARDMRRTGLFDKTPSTDLIPNALKNEDGSPLILYHGRSTARVAEEGVDVTRSSGFLGQGFYSDTETAVANQFTGIDILLDDLRPSITPVVLTPKNLVKAEDTISLELAGSMIDDALGRFQKALPEKTLELAEIAKGWKVQSITAGDERNLYMVHAAVRDMAGLQPVITELIDDVVIREISLAQGIDAVSSPNIVESKWLKQPVTNPGSAGTVANSGREYVAYSNDIVVSQFDERIMTGPSKWDNIREASMDETNIQFTEVFPDYTNMNALDQGARFFYPFWIYETQRWPWIIRNAIQKPGAMTTWGRYTNATDGGYMPIPGTDLQINMLRGTVLAGGLRRLYMKDFPEYADQFEWPVEVLDAGSRWGFYPGFHIMAPIALFGAGSRTARPQVGELIPPWATTLLSAINNVAPGSKWAQTLTEVIFPDRFRDYRTLLAVNDAGGDGFEILNNIRSGTELSPEDDSMWVQARQRVMNIAGLLDAQFGLFRFRPQEMQLAYDASRQGFAELTGVPVEDQERIQDRFNVTGTRATDIYPLDPLEQYVMREVLDKFKKWLRPNIAPLLPSMQGDIAFKTTSYFNELENIWVAARTEGFFELNESTGQMELRYKSLNTIHEEWASGKISERERSVAVQATQQQAIIRSQALGEINYYKDVPKTRKQREEFFIRFDIPIPSYSAGQELLWAYYDIQPKLELDDEGVMRVNWERYFMEIDTLLEAMLPNERNRLLSRIQADWTDSQRLRWSDSNNYLRAYKNVARVVKAEFTPEEQLIIEKFLRSDSPEREIIRREVETDEGKLIATYEKNTQNFRRNLRLTNPMLDAKLLFWNEVQKPLTVKARTLANELITMHRPGAALFTVDIE